VAAGDRRHGLDDLGRIRIQIEELADDDVGLQADRLGVGANEGPAEDSRRPLRDVAALQRFEERLLDLRLFGNRAEADLLLLAPLAEASAEAFRHAP
jgi:hypothetical protein